MDTRREGAAAGAQQPIDFASMIASLEAARDNFNVLRDRHHDEVSKLQQVNLKRSQEVCELNAAREAQVQKFDAASAAQRDAYNELRIYHEQLTQKYSIQSVQLASLTAEVAELKGSNQSLEQKVASLELGAASQLQAYKDLKIEHDEAVAFQEEQSKVLIRVNAVKNAQAGEVAKLKAAAAAPQVKVQEQAQVDTLKTRASKFEKLYEDERKRVAELRTSNSEQVKQVADKSAELESLTLRFADLTRAQQEQRDELLRTQKEHSRHLQELISLRSSCKAQGQLIAEFEAGAAYAELSRAHSSQISEIATIKALLESQLQELSQLRCEKQAWREEVSALTADSEVAAARYSTLCARYDKLKAFYVNLDNSNKTLQTDHRSLNMDLCNMHAEKRELTARYEQLKVEMRGLQETKAYHVRVSKRLGEENAEHISNYEKLQREYANARSNAEPAVHVDQSSAKKRKIEETCEEPCLC